MVFPRLHVDLPGTSLSLQTNLMMSGENGIEIVIAIFSSSAAHHGDSHQTAGPVSGRGGGDHGQLWNHDRGSAE